MKKSLLYYWGVAILMLFLSVGFSACGGDDDDEEIGGESYRPVLLSTAKPFSISPTKKVYFASGNLQYQPSTNQWRFAEHQWDIIGENNKEISNYSSWIDLFGWGTGDTPLKTSTNEKDYTTWTDWGKNIGDGKTWFTLSSDEWDYFYKNHSHHMIELNGVEGYLFLPDGAKWLYNGDGGDIFDFGDGKILKITEYDRNASWNELEEAGALFLPCTYSRNGKNFYNHSYRYWSSTEDCPETSAYEIDISNGEIYYSPTFWGCSVRLVRLAK